MIRNSALISSSYSSFLCSRITTRRGEISNRAVKIVPTQYTSHSSRVFVEVPIAEKVEDSERDALVSFPAIALRLLEGVYVRSNRRFSVIVKSGELLLPERWEPGPYDLGKVGKSDTSGVPLYRRGNFLYFPKGRDRKVIEEALFIGTRAPDNYYHWLINGLSQLFVANGAKDLPRDVPVIVPERVKFTPQFSESLKVVSENRPIVFMADDDIIYAKRLWVIDPPPVYDTPLSLDVEKRIRLPFHEQALLDFRRRILSEYGLGNEANGTKRKLFLIRPTDDARSEHQNQLLEIARGAGYEPFRPETHSFEEQVRQFAITDRIIGPSGAAFTNLLFTVPNSRSLILKARFLPRENFFANLAGISDGRVFSLSNAPAADKETRLRTLHSFEKALELLE